MSLEITSYTHYSFYELKDKLKQVKLRGFNQIPIYEYSSITYHTELDVDLDSFFLPAQNYVLADKVKRLVALYYLFQEKGINIFDLNGYIEFDMVDNGVLSSGIPLLPVVAEWDWAERRTLLNDGMHRAYTANLLKDVIPSFGFVHIFEVPREYPYYAFPIKQGWKAVEEIAFLTDDYKKKEYRLPGDKYKELFRDFNAVFPGVQVKRETVPTTATA